MPEGDTVYRAARLLDRHLSGHVLTGTDFRVPQHATADLSGGRVVTTISRGKHLLTRIAGPADDERWTLHTHLKMEGAWRVHDPGRPWKRPAHQVRVVLRTAGAVAVGFSLGIGNMYAAELCFTSGVHPATPIGDVAGLPRLVRRARQMLDLNKERPVQSTTGDLRERERMWVYRRDRSPCRRCGTPIAVAQRGPAGRERASYWCPRCQPEPTP